MPYYFKFLVSNKRRTAVTLGLLVSLIVLGFMLGNTRGLYLEQQTRLLDNQKTNLQQTIYQLEYRNNILAVELDVERAANRSLLQELRTTQDEINQTRRELAFYQRVLAPELDAEGITIDSVLVRSIPATESYYFRVILLHTERLQQLVRGRMEVFVRGQQDGQRTEYNVLELSGAESSSVEFAMSYFSLQEATWTFPANFNPESFVVRVRSSTGQQTERQFPWAELVTYAEEFDDES